MVKAMGPFRDSQAHSWLLGLRTDVPTEPPSHRPCPQVDTYITDIVSSLVMKFGPIRSIMFIKTCTILGVSYPVKNCDFIISDCRRSNSVLEIPLRKKGRECTYLSYDITKQILELNKMCTQLKNFKDEWIV
jgi:hypothetical protein